MKKFDIIVSDPPWSYEDKLRMKGSIGIKRSADSHYDVMHIDAIKAIPVPDIAADNCLLALWVPNSLLNYGLDTMKAWGFTQKQIFMWIKTSKGPSGLAFGMGRYFRNCSELALIGTKGKLKLHDKSQRNVALDPALPHSQKPETLQDRLEIMYPNLNYLEMFARRDKSNWTCVGNECPSTMGSDINDWIKNYSNT